METLNLRNGADIEGTVANIKKDLEFKGHNIWILIFSIFIASIGLNLNSTAVVIGAMLISPLMGPIQGIGLSLGTNDFNTLIISFRNLIIMVVVAVFTSFVFFTISPFQDAQSELLGRTKPNLFDAFVAIFGGLAGIIAGSRYERGNVIPGVAIATALMPPLCTAGFGLATNHIEYFFGAFYLFLLNSAFICISTIIVVRYLRIPMVHYINPKKERQTKYLLTGLAVVVIIPSLITLFTVIQSTRFDHQVDAFLKNEVRIPGSSVIASKPVYNSDSTSSIQQVLSKINGDTAQIKSTLTLTIIGENVEENKIDSLQLVLNSYVQNTKLRVLQTKDKSFEFNQTINEMEENSIELEDAFGQAKQTISYQEGIINKLNKQVEILSRDSVNVDLYFEEISAFYPDVLSMKGGVMHEKGKRFHTFFLYWKPSKRRYVSHAKEENNIRNWLSKKIESDSIMILSF